MKFYSFSLERIYKINIQILGNLCGLKQIMIGLFLSLVILTHIWSGVEILNFFESRTPETWKAYNFYLLVCFKAHVKMVSWYLQDRHFSAKCHLGLISNTYCIPALVPEVFRLMGKQTCKQLQHNILCYKKSIFNKILYNHVGRTLLLIRKASLSCHLSWTFKNDIIDKVLSRFLPQQQGTFF